MARKNWLRSNLLAGFVATGALLGACSEDDDASGGDASTEEGDGGPGDAPTWHQDIAPLVGAKCAQCHKPGGIGPFSLESYEDARVWKDAIVDATQSGRMPPFLAQETDDCQPRLPWKDDLRLSEQQKDMLKDWAEADAPEGDADDAAPVELPEPVTLEQEDIVLQIPEPITVEGTDDIHTCVIVDPEVEEDTYVINRLIYPGNDKVLHHSVTYVVAPGEHEDGTPRTKEELEQVFIEQKGVGIGGRYDCFGGPSLEDGISAQLLNTWAPGSIPQSSPPDSGQPLLAGSLILIDLHYHPTGAGPETDSETRLALTTTDEHPTYIARSIFMGNFSGDRETEAGSAKLVQQDGEDEPEFLIPAGVAHHEEKMEWTWGLASNTELRVYGLGTHMHYVGRSMRIELENSGNGPSDEPDRECLIETPNWDFNWQRGYAYDADIDEFPAMNTDDVLHLTCIFDNSLDNPFMAEALADQGLDEPVDVALGEDTLDEMCLGVIGIMYPNTAALAGSTPAR